MTKMEHEYVSERFAGNSGVKVAGRGFLYWKEQLQLL